MLKKIINGDYLKRMDNIKQWQELDVFKEESVSQHSYKVTILARILLEDIFGKNTEFKVQDFKTKVITRALFHDWDEALILRDMSHETKYNEFNGKEIREALNNYSAHVALKEFDEKDNNCRTTDCSKMMWNMICSESVPVQSFVKLCDWIAAIFYMKREKQLGNKNLEKSWDLAKNNFFQAIDTVLESLKLNFADTEMNFEELLNLKTIFQDG